MASLEFKVARLRAGLTQKKMAEELGLAEPTISAYECGRMTPGPEMRYRIAKLLNTTPEALFLKRGV